VLPSVSLLSSLHQVGPESEDGVNFFKKALLIAGICKLAADRFSKHVN
jgi:hypothetical protein